MRLRSLAIAALLSLLLLMLLLFVSCAPANPDEIIIISQAGVVLARDISVPSNPPTNWVSVRQEACKSYMDVNLQQAYWRFTFPIFWTFHTNFFDLAPADSPDIRVGCLRYYWRDTSETNDMHGGKTFTGTIDSAVIILCEKKEFGILDTQTLSPSIPSSNFQRAATDSSLPQRITRMNDGAYLVCPLDINAALQKLAATQAFTNDLLRLSLLTDRQAAQEEVAVMNRTPFHEYDEFMAAAVISTTTKLPLHTSSIIFYEPQGSALITESPRISYEIELSLIYSATRLEPHLAGTRLNGEHFDALMSSDRSLCSVPDLPFYLWVSFGKCLNPDPNADPNAALEDCDESWTGQTSYLEFISRTAQPRQALNICHVEPALVQTSLPLVPFYAGPAHLYIGYNPKTDERIWDELLFYEVWFDPDSAIRPSRVQQ